MQICFVYVELDVRLFNRSYPVVFYYYSVITFPATTQQYRQY